MVDDVPWRYVAKQQVRGSGRQRMRGLVATRDLTEGEEICGFHIDSIFPTEASAADKGMYYVIRAAFDKYLRLTKIDCRCNALTAYNNMVAALANHATSKMANTKIVVHNSSSSTATATLKACKKIKNGDAILVNYGSSRWTRAFGKRVRNSKKKYPNLFQRSSSSKKAKEC
jgi:hypothetical protein